MERRKKILIVDNDEEILVMLQKILEENVNFDAQSTWSGREALALLKSGEFDVLLVDDYLPDMHSNNFLVQVGKLPVQPWIVAMQASAPSPGDLRQYASLGVFSVVRKHHIAQVCQAVSSCCAEGPLAKACVS